MGRGFKGEYNHTVDAKGRLIVPAKFREALGETFVVTKGLDGCLFLYPNEEWAIMTVKWTNRVEYCCPLFCAILRQSEKKLC